MLLFHFISIKRTFQRSHSNCENGVSSWRKFNPCIQDHENTPAKTWKEIVEWVIVTVQTLAQQNLTLRRHRESVTNNENPGKFLSFVKIFG